MGKRSKRTLTLLAMIFASAGLHGNALREVKAESVWYNTGANCYTVDADRVVAEGNTGKNNNFCLTDQYDTYGDYRFTVSATGTLGLPNEVEHDIGLIPWYIDSDNYILIYLNWSDSDRPSELREIQITGRVNGTQPYIFLRFQRVERLLDRRNRACVESDQQDCDREDDFGDGRLRFDQSHGQRFDFDLCRFPRSGQIPSGKTESGRIRLQRYGYVHRFFLHRS